MTNPFIRQQPQPAAPAMPATAPYPQPQQTFQQGIAAYAPQTQYSGAPVGGGMVAQPGMFGTPPPPVLNDREDRPPVKALVRRLLIIVPKGIERNIESKKHKSADGSPVISDRLTADVIVLDGGALFWGGNTPGAQQFNKPVPHVIKGMWLSQRSLVQQSESALQARDRGDAANALVLGRLWQAGEEQNSPYVLAPASPEDIAVFNAYVQHTNPYAV